MKAIISRTINGAWIRFVDKESGEPSEDMSFDFQDEDTDEFNPEELLGMFWEISSRMGWEGDRHDRARLKISVVHGDKFEHCENDLKKDCKICRDNNPVLSE